VRLARVVIGGWGVAVVSVVGGVRGTNEKGGDEDGEPRYLKVEVEGVVTSGHAYLYFPTLSWRVWENHPYSVLSTFATASSGSESSQGSSSSLEKVASEEGSLSTIRPRATFLIRPMNGLTNKLLARTLASSGQIRIPVLLEASYHSNPAIHDLNSCSTLLCIAGGVGITGVLSIAQSFPGVSIKLVWGVRDASLLKAVEDSGELARLRKREGSEVAVSVGERIRVGDVLREELDKEDRGKLGVVVCGPAGMADEVRANVAELGSKSNRGVVFVDEAYRGKDIPKAWCSRFLLIIKQLCDYRLCSRSPRSKHDLHHLSRLRGDPSTHLHCVEEITSCASFEKG